jgi:glucosamine--fructose-6-phosphate aminotransferase (isomerizing)
LLGAHFEAEIREQPDVWRRIADSNKAMHFAHAIGDRSVLFVGSGSSLFVGMLGALALRRRGIHATALAATEAHFDNAAYRDSCVVALSQSGKSADLLSALDILQPQQLIAITNSPQSPLAERAHVVIDIEAGPEIAVPASKSVTAMAAILLWGAALRAGKSTRSAATLTETAEDVRGWLEGEGVAEVIAAARRLARRRAVVIVSAGYGVPIAMELALKMKEASYVHAEGFAAGEFRHGSSAMLDASCAIVGIVDEHARNFVNRPLAEAAEAEALRYVIGGRLADIPLLGPVTGDAFNSLAWLVAGQMLALNVGRAVYVESDSPRGLSKYVV